MNYTVSETAGSSRIEQEGCNVAWHDLEYPVVPLLPEPQPTQARPTPPLVGDWEQIGRSKQAAGRAARNATAACVSMLIFGSVCSGLLSFSDRGFSLVGLLFGSDVVMSPADLLGSLWWWIVGAPILAIAPMFVWLALKPTSVQLAQYRQYEQWRSKVYLPWLQDERRIYLSSLSSEEREVLFQHVEHARER